MDNKLDAAYVKLSDIRNKREEKNWTSENVVVKEEKGDMFFGNKAAENEFLNKKFAEYEKLQELNRKVVAGGVRPLIYDSDGKHIERGTNPEFTQKSVSVMKSVEGAPDVAKTLEALGNQLSATPKDKIENAMDLQPKDVDIKGKKATIGTFNIEWLGTKKRTEEDYKEIAQVIKDSGAQLLGIQEVSQEKGLKSVMQYLPNYGYILGKSGGQKVGVLFDKDRVKYDVNSIDQVDEAKVGARLRAPLLVNMKLDDGFDFTFVVCHFKAMFDDAAMETRTDQAKGLMKWVRKHFKESEDKDLIMVGDFNDFVDSDTLKPLHRGQLMHFATEEIGEDAYTNIPYGGVIDHALLSDVPGGAMEEYIEGSLHTIDENKYPHYVESVSDHKPVLFEVRSDIDND